MYRYLILAFLVVSLAGCSSNQTLKDTWKFTDRQYKTFLNTPATVDLDDKGNGSDYEIALGEAVLEVDREVNTLVRIMENTGRSVDAEWVYSTMRRLPWLSGIALVDDSGSIITQFPESQDSFDATPLLQEDPKQRMAMLRGFVQMAEKGPEVYVGNPIYVGETLRGLVVAHFDPRNLLMKSPNPGAFSMVSPAGVLWAGSAGSVAGVNNWEEELQHRSSGVDGGCYWVARYIGNLPIVYAIPVGAVSVATSSQSEESETQNVESQDAPANE